MATTKSKAAKVEKNPDFPYKGDPEDIPMGASKPAGEKVSQVSGGGEASEAPLADHHDIAYRDRDPGLVGDAPKPGKRVIKTKDTGTLVENLGGEDEEEGETVVAQQPGETYEEARARSRGSKSK